MNYEKPIDAEEWNQRCKESAEKLQQLFNNPHIEITRIDAKIAKIRQDCTEPDCYGCAADIKQLKAYKKELVQYRK